jgi:hypothetical protein
MRVFVGWSSKLLALLDNRLIPMQENEVIGKTDTLGFPARRVASACGTEARLHRKVAPDVVFEAVQCHVRE